MHILETIPSRLELLDGFVAGTIDRISPLTREPDDVFHVKLALHEAIVNAVKHGNKMDPDLSVRVDIDADSERVMIRVTDQGQGFDYKKIPDPITPENLEKLNGRGIFLMQNAMDKVEFADGGRTIQMVKFLKH